MDKPVASVFPGGKGNHIPQSSGREVVLTSTASELPNNDPRQSELYSISRTSQQPLSPEPAGKAFFESIDPRASQEANAYPGAVDEAVPFDKTSLATRQFHFKLPGNENRLLFLPTPLTVNPSPLRPLSSCGPLPRDNARPIEGPDINHVFGNLSIYDEKIVTFSQSVRAAVKSKMDTFAVLNLQETDSPQRPDLESSNCGTSSPAPGTGSIITAPGSALPVPESSHQEYREQLTSASHGSSVVDDSMNRTPSG